MAKRAEARQQSAQVSPFAKLTVCYVGKLDSLFVHLFGSGLLSTPLVLVAVCLFCTFVTVVLFCAVRHAILTNIDGVFNHKYILLLQRTRHKNK